MKNALRVFERGQNKLFNGTKIYPFTLFQSTGNADGIFFIEEKSHNLVHFEKAAGNRVGFRRLGKAIWRSVNLVKFQRSFMRLTLLQISLPTILAF